MRGSVHAAALEGNSSVAKEGELGLLIAIHSAGQTQRSTIAVATSLRYMEVLDR
jgi:hypothetical protein